MKITINGKNYDTKPFDFGGLLKLEECGISLTDLEHATEKPITLITSLVAWVINGTKEDAIKEINNHISNGGTLADITKIVEVIKDSDFFQKAMK